MATVLEKALNSLLNASVAGSDKDKFRAQQFAREALDASKQRLYSIQQIRDEVDRLETIAHLPWPRKDADEFRETIERIRYGLDHLP